MAISRFCYCSFADLQKPQVELDGKACAAVCCWITLVFIVLLSDVNGLYNGPPTNLHLKLIHTYVEQKPQKAIIFGDKSRMGRGGKDSKVKAASNAAAYSGTPVVIASGYAPNNHHKGSKWRTCEVLYSIKMHIYGFRLLKLVRTLDGSFSS
ncbi:hypothetical protein L1987_79266 [Smallanthus sonchifolius]|uniref:Uncharacterized protein n=1 Tax=Smallanthus sonchifolius TaxID=185202 RepID=A0ACB8ZG07_9ASTR|nr:hypothetical protein L1987_79266 [Smallanthus sonchifolius]